jgi:3-oxoacyl-[acyl-carrier protein] reductase
VYNFQERTILYTGAAGGLGLPTTLSYLEAGAKVVVLDNDLAKIDALRSAANDCDGLHIFAATGGIDTLINNAAIYPSKPFVEFSIEEFQLVERINVESAVLCAQGTFPYMKERHFGRIVNISSITFNGAWTNLSAYMASKGALIGLTRAWAREFGEFGVSVNSISPGAFPTDAEKIQGDPAAYNQFCLDSQAIKRRGAPADITNALMFFTSRESGFITGQNLNVDGGWVMS